MKVNRLEFIDRMKGIAILLVIMSHIIAYNNIDGGVNSSLLKIICSFHLPLLFILSGYIASLGWDKIVSLTSLINFVCKKSYTLLLPLLTWTLIVNKYFFAPHFEAITTADLLKTVVLPDLWFLQILFEIQFLFGLFCFLSHYWNKNGGLFVSIIFFGIVFLLLVAGYLLIDTVHFSTLILYTSFFFLGSFISKYAVLERFIMKTNVFAIALVLFLVLATHWSMQGNTIDDILKVMLSAGAFIVLLHLTKKVNGTNSFIDSQIQLFGKESLAIYLMQFFLTSKILFLSELEGYNVYIQLVLLVAITIPIAYLCVLVHRIVQKSYFLDFILYGKK